MDLTISQDLRIYRSRALAAMNSVGIHAWVPEQEWDAEADAQAYCLDAVGTIPSGSHISFKRLFNDGWDALPSRTRRS